jgi:vitamin B12/bleomycin/antimicrobial peptide transport system ATP-binding/permease protein
VPVKRSRSRRFFLLACQFWSGETRLRAWLLTAAVLAFVAAQIVVAVGINNWNRQFFDALETREVGAIWAVVVWLPVLVVIAALVLSGLLVSRMVLQTRWREFLTVRLVGWWVSDQRYHALQFAAPDLPAPEYRIADDGRLSIEPLVEFVIGLITAAVSAVAFAAILWRVAGSANFMLGSTAVVIPSYMALAAIVYAAVTSYAAYLAGWPLVKRIAGKNEAEARFRAEMTRLRENAESIALIRGDADERASLVQNYRRVVAVWFGVIRQQGIVALVLNANSAFFPIVPLLLIAPKYVSGEVTLGAVMQIVAAFMAVQAALIWFVDNFLRLAEWFASVARVDELQEALGQLDMDKARQAIQRGEGPDGGIRIDRLSLTHGDGTPMLAETTLVIEQGEHVLVGGESGAGKSTLIRALAGLWPWGTGSIDFPPGRSVAFIPQKPYLPLGSLRTVLLYPNAGSPTCDTLVLDVMRRCGLGEMGQRLDEVAPWDRVLSGGERQRVAFARLLLQRPDIVIMDEATSALDEESQTSLMRLFDDELRQATVISVGHRASLDRFHDRKVTMTKMPGGAKLTSALLPREAQAASV